jgi:hypothetical protein
MPEAFAQNELIDHGLRAVGAILGTDLSGPTAQTIHLPLTTENKVPA